MVEIREVCGAADIRAFIKFPLELYRGNPYFVPLLYGDEKKLLRSGGCNEEVDAVFYLARRDGKTVGRIQGLVQKQYNRTHGTAQARFTRFDCIDDAEVSAALLAAVESWAAERGMQELCGPLGANDLDREGLLIEGFEELSTFEEQYNYPYYATLIEQAGFEKDVDWLEFELRRPEKRNEMLARVAQRTLEINKLHVADTKMSKRRYIEKYRDGFFACLDECYRGLYGTVEIARETQDALIAQFMMLINKEYLVFICDEQENVVAFGLCFPGFGNALQKSGGRLTPMTLWRLLRTVKAPRTVDLGLVAVLPRYQMTGLNAVIVNKLQEVLESGRVESFETNLNLETNEAVMAQWKYFSARQHKRRRSYIKKIQKTGE